MGEVVPTAETCATPGDEDCDGASNEEGDGCLCVPGEVEACPYNGPAGTEGIGLCQAGSRTCEPSGVAFGACEGEVVPVLEVCATIGDDDCDGEVNEEGNDCICVPASVEACYSGPPATEGVGTCQGGLHTCEPNGLGFGSCVGEVTPAFDACSSALDENCDGMTVACTGAYQWLLHWGDTIDSVSRADLAVDSSNNVVWLGGAFEQIDLGAGPIGNEGYLSFVLAKFDAAGSLLWGSAFVNGYPSGLSLDGSGNILMTGRGDSGIDFGGGPLPGAGYPTLVIAKLNANGNHIWSQSFQSDNGDAYLNTGGITADHLGNVIITGRFSGTWLDLGGTNFPSGGGYLAKYSPAGAHLWSKVGAGGYAVAVDSSNNVIASGIGVLEKYDSGGTWLWSHGCIAPGSSAWVRGVAVDDNDDIFITGQVSGSFNCGAGAVPAVSFLAKLDAAGNHMWSLPDLGGRDVFVDPGGDIVAAGDGSVVKVDPQGNVLWSHVYPSYNAAFQTVAADALGAVLGSGILRYTVDFGAGSVTATPPANPDDFFLLQLAP